MNLTPNTYFIQKAITEEMAGNLWALAYRQAGFYPETMECKKLKKKCCKNYKKEKRCKRCPMHS
jgi:hypothetical protein